MPRLLIRPTTPLLDQRFTINRDSMQAEGLVGWWVFRPGRNPLADLTDGGALFAVVGGAAFQPSIGGPGLYEVANGDGVSLTAPAYLKPAASVTLVWRAIIHGASAAGNSTCGMLYGDASAAPYAAWAYQTDGFQTMRLLHSQDGAFNNGIAVASAITYGAEALWVATLKSGSQILYRDGVSIGSEAISGAGFSYTAGSLFQVNATTAFSRDLNATTLELRVYNRALSPQEVWQLWAPQTRWELYRPAKWRTIIRPSPAETDSVVGPGGVTTIPSGHAGNIVLSLTGVGSVWVDGVTVFTPSGVANVTKISQNVTDFTHATLTITTGAGTGTLTITETVTGSATCTIAVATATMSASPNTGTTGGNASTAFTGVNTLWDTDTPTFSLSGGTGASIGATTATAATAASATVTYGSAAGTLTITDPSTGATCTIAVSAAVAARRRMLMGVGA